MNLNDIGIKYGTDKVNHGFLPYYEKALEGKDIKTVIEVGIWQGASLRMWSEYYPNAKVIGIDDKQIQLFNEGNIECYWADQENYRTILDIVRKYDCNLFVDDGSHIWTHQISTFMCVWFTLKPGSIYILEDLHSSYIDLHNFKRGEIKPFHFIIDFVQDNNIKHTLVYNNNGKSISIIMEK